MNRAYRRTVRLAVEAPLTRREAGRPSAVCGATADSAAAARSGEHDRTTAWAEPAQETPVRLGGYEPCAPGVEYPLRGKQGADGRTTPMAAA